MNPARTIGRLANYGLAWAQGLVGLFGAGAVLFEAHRLFLRYYANEWGAVQLEGPNDCSQVGQIANGDLIGGETFCNQPINFVPWVEVYRHHPVAAAAYYGSVLAAILIAGSLLFFVQRRLATASPFGAVNSNPDPGMSEHLR